MVADPETIYRHALAQVCKYLSELPVRKRAREKHKHDAVQVCKYLSELPESEEAARKKRMYDAARDDPRKLKSLYNRTYYEKHSEQLIEKMKRYNALHCEALREYRRKYFQKKKKARD